MMVIHNLSTGADGTSRRCLKIKQCSKNRQMLPPKPLAASFFGCRQTLGGMLAATLAKCKKASVHAGLQRFCLGGNLGANLAGSCRQAATPFRVAATGGILAGGMVGMWKTSGPEGRARGSSVVRTSITMIFSGWQLYARNA